MRYEEPYQRRKKAPSRRRRRKSLGGWLAELCLRLLALVLTLAILGLGVLYALPVSLFAVEPEGADLSLTDGLPEDRANILLLGLDAVRDNNRRSDAVLIASVGYGTLKLTSILRDTIVDIPGHGSGKLNAAYAYGGPQLVIRTLNENFKLNIIHYVAVDFTALANLVDALGGVTLSVTEAEVQAVNQLIGDNRAKLSALGYTAPDLMQSGDDIRLNGVQALAYARVRKLDSDFGRAGRQRRLLSAMLQKLKASLWNPVTLVRLAKVVFSAADTDLSPAALLSLGLKALTAGPPDQLRLPVDSSFTDDGSSLRIDNLDDNIGALQRFIYGNEE